LVRGLTPQERFGYESSSYFSKVFKKYVGLSPEQFQQQ
jgi:AraC-like DNA-binding protein